MDPELKKCNHCDVGNSLADHELRMQDILNEMYALGRRLETWGRYKEFANYETIFFDVITETDKTTGEMLISYKFKDGLASAADVLTNNDCEVEWVEPRICGAETEIAEAAAKGATVIKVKSLKPLAGIGVNSTVLVTKLSDGTPVNGLYIESIASGSNEITLQNPLPVALEEGDIVRR